ncbi:hypothetical protein [Streptomyces sp. NP-1717]|uniref:hypothetical protein n=1 Tax=unclassified Streptomyces TaxID=2593676 RepID=UPI0027E55E63|nr:hypothetical protein [Streptomyces sp. NP-1717]MCI3221859.1 hypothetical protein [Streptomyces sp. NP-1717]
MSLSDPTYLPNALYHQVLHAHQPDEEADGFTDAFPLKTASRVEGMRGAGAA